MPATPVRPVPSGGGRGFGRSPHRAGGFTLVELVLVLLLVTILAVVVVPRLFSTGLFQQRGFVDTLGAALRYARLEAWATECPVQVTLTSTQYRLHQRSGCTTGAFTQAVRNPATQAPFQGAVPKGTAITGGTGTWQYAASGAPANTRTITVTGNGVATLTVYAGTGYVQTRG